MRFRLLMTLVLRIWFMQIFARPKKTHEARTGCILLVACQNWTEAISSDVLRRNKRANLKTFVIAL